MSRRIERRVIFLDDSFCLHFLDLLGEMIARFRVEVHAYVLMGNHYHLILRTPAANASQAMQWLNVSFSAWSNAKHQRVSHVFQGRFRSTLIDGDGAWLLKASAFIEQARKWVKSVTLEHSDRSFVASRIPFDAIVAVVELIKGESFCDFRNRHGDWGLGMVLYLARRRLLTSSRSGAFRVW